MGQKNRPVTSTHCVQVDHGKGSGDDEAQPQQQLLALDGQHGGESQGGGVEALGAAGPGQQQDQHHRQ